jgi:hypothetical protein
MLLLVSLWYKLFDRIYLYAVRRLITHVHRRKRRVVCCSVLLPRGDRRTTETKLQNSGLDSPFKVSRSTPLIAIRRLRRRERSDRTRLITEWWKTTFIDIWPRSNYTSATTPRACEGAGCAQTARI